MTLALSLYSYLFFSPYLSNTTFLRNNRAFDQEQIISTIEAARTGTNPSLPADYLAKVGENLTYIQSTRASRRLFVGNLPSHLDLNEFVIAQFFKAYMAHCGFKTPEPILTVSLAESLTYAFVEFRGVEDATAVCYMMNGVNMGGRKLRVARPKDYRPPAPDLAQFIVQYAPGQYRPPPVRSLGELDPNAEVPATNFVGNVDTSERIVVILRGLLKTQELVSDAEWLDIVDDMREEAALCLRDPPYNPQDPTFSNRVRRIAIPRPSRPQGTSREVDSKTGNYAPSDAADSSSFIAYGPWDQPEDVGNVYILFTDSQAAEKAASRLQNRLYNTTVINAEVCPLKDYADKYEY